MQLLITPTMALVIFTLILPTPADSACQEGWVDATSVGLGCLHFDIWNYYTWEEARLHCVEQGARLVEIYNKEQQETMVTAINAVGYRTWWNGATRQPHLDSPSPAWYWIDSMVEVEQFGWGKDKPSGQVDHDCAFLYYGLGYDWMDAPCTSSYKAVCQAGYQGYEG